jgi:hypothetical protein
VVIPDLNGSVMSKDDPNYRFVFRANPQSWLLCAANLHEQAIWLRRHSGRAMLSQLDADGMCPLSRDGGNRSLFLLAGFAIENAIKAFLVLENPSWISNGKIASPLRSHSLTTLESRCESIPMKGERRWLLERLESGLESWARYPCALTAAETTDEGDMELALWKEYLVRMKAYRLELIELLSRPWKGPHGFEGRWIFSGDFFEDESAS